MARAFGEIAGYPPGSTLPDRRALSRAGVHRPTQHGISGSQTEGADSIVVSGGYEDDQDDGDLIVYTGAGGRDPATGRQIADQELSDQNLALALSATDGLPVRVIRGRGGNPARSPVTGYRYDGLFRVDDFWDEAGRSGFKVVRYRLEKLPAEPIGAIGPPVTTGTPGPAPRVNARTQRIVRNTAITQRVKELHGHCCQVCGEVVETATGPYAEGGHIRPLGRPHDGPDVESNVLCLCPTDHVRLDYGGIVITDDLDVVNALTGIAIGPLRTIPGHRIDLAHVLYHRQVRTF